MGDVADLRRRLRRLKDQAIDDQLKRTHKGLAEDIDRSARPNVRVKTGRARGTLRFSGTVRDAVNRAGNRSTPYLPPLHWKIGPPFLTDAAAREEAVLEPRYLRELGEMYEREIGTG